MTKLPDRQVIRWNRIEVYCVKNATGTYWAMSIPRPTLGIKPYFLGIVVFGDGDEYHLCHIWLIKAIGYAS